MLCVGTDMAVAWNIENEFALWLLLL